MSTHEEVKRDLAAVINRHNLDNDSNTRDYILAEFLYDCLAARNRADAANVAWHTTQVGTPFKTEAS